MSPLDRRSFLRATAGALGVLVLPGCAALVSTPVTPEGNLVRLPLDLHPQLSEPDGSLKLQLPDGNQLYVVVLGPREYAALSPICTHLGCTVNLEGSGMLCPCHGSLFDREGKVLRGPATLPLRRYPASVTGDGWLVIDLAAGAA